MVFMSLVNLIKFIVKSSLYIANINKTLKDVKFNIMVNFIQANQQDLTITTNKVAYILNLNTIKKYQEH